MLHDTCNDANTAEVMHGMLEVSRPSFLDIHVIHYGIRKRLQPKPFVAQRYLSFGFLSSWNVVEIGSAEFNSPTSL